MISAALVISVSFLAQVPPPNAAAALSADLQRAHDEILEREAAALGTLADHLKGQGNTAAADEIRSRIARSAPSDAASRFVPLPDVVPSSKRGKGLANVPARPAPAAAPWREELDKVRSKAAGEFFDLATRAVSKEPRHYALADQCLRAVLERRPDHPEARRLLGYVPYEGGWATPYAAQLLRKGNVLHATYGWVPASWVPHLEQGDLPAPTEPGQRQVRWLPAREADRLHGDWAKAWKIPTEHFLIQTNVPLSEAITFSRQLEELHELFFSLLADVFGEALPLARRFRDPKMTGEPRANPHTVYYFATRQEYIDYLTPRQGPDIEQSLGIYIPPKGGKEKRAPAYFFRDEGGQLPVTATLYHEVSHQLLFESGLGDPNAYQRNDGNYWVFEGLGTYFETLRTESDGSLEVGGLVGRRIEEAKTSLVRKNEYIPLAQFVRFDQDGLHQGNAYVKYQEAHALGLFFMQAQGGRYREAFLDYVRDAARGRLKRATGRSLEDRVGVPCKRLDAEVIDFLKAGAAPAGG
jgi:hypothetical protein